MGRDVDYRDQGVAQFFEARANGVNIIGIRAPATVASNIDIELLATLPGSTQVLTISSTGQMGTTPIGAGDLDDSYDFPTAGAGRTITADSGAVVVNVPVAGGNDGLLVDQNDNFIGIEVTKDGTGAGSGIRVTNAGTGLGVEVIQNGIAIGLTVTQNAVAVAAQITQAQNANGLFVSKTAVGAGIALLIQNLGTGNGLTVDQDGNGVALDVDVAAASTSTGLNIVNAGTGVGLLVTQTGVMDAAQFIQTQNDNGVFIQKTGAGAGDALLVQNLGTGIGLSVDQDGNAIALNVDINAASSSVGLNMVNAGSGTGLSLLQTGVAIGLFVDQNTNAIGISVDIAAGSSSAGVQVLHAGSGNGVFIDQDGNGIALNIDSEATSEPLLNLLSLNANTRGDIRFQGRNSDASGALFGDFWYNTSSERLKLQLDASHIATVASNYQNRFGPIDTITIATAVATLTGSHTVLAAESGTVDTVSTITPAPAQEIGDVFMFRSDTGDTITLDEAGNMQLNGSDIVLSNPNDSAVLMWTGANFIEISRATGVTA